eukprot:TRINITY_DN1848_c0_g2_i1.p1 TRINITY_DN1848_c0_g2~~TRINITY_DN1848_c0_g2_i1.p1  ORF type:complete len:451 (-),score=136.81 TRINITY_DN1848_c0_g2_i1:13-1365(-)
MLFKAINDQMHRLMTRVITSIGRTKCAWPTLIRQWRSASCCSRVPTMTLFWRSCAHSSTPTCISCRLLTAARRRVSSGTLMSVRGSAASLSTASDAVRSSLHTTSSEVPSSAATSPQLSRSASQPEGNVVRRHSARTLSATLRARKRPQLFEEPKNDSVHVDDDGVATAVSSAADNNNNNNNGESKPPNFSFDVRQTRYTTRADAADVLCADTGALMIWLRKNKWTVMRHMPPRGRSVEPQATSPRSSNSISSGADNDNDGGTNGGGGGIASRWRAALAARRQRRERDDKSASGNSNDSSVAIGNDDNDNDNDNDTKAESGDVPLVPMDRIAAAFVMAHASGVHVHFRPQLEVLFERTDDDGWRVSVHYYALMKPGTASAIGMLTLGVSLVVGAGTFAKYANDAPITVREVWAAMGIAAKSADSRVDESTTPRGDGAHAKSPPPSPELTV